MKLSPKTLPELLNHGFDTVIDVRSPAEFAEDHVPGAINLPVLDNEERARVGTMYKQESPFKARKIGAALVFENAARHLRTSLSHHEGSWRPLVYCWRGGQRSGSFAWMLGEIGWRPGLIDGGYRTFRRLVSGYLYEHALPHRFIQLGGYTGSAKTELLHRLAQRGLQVLDLEGLANHRGSLLGGMDGGQPSQKGFETELAQRLLALSPDRPVIVEAESSKIGDINLPPSLWEGMKAAPWLEVDIPVEVRARYLADAYADVLADGAALMEKLAPLRYHRGHALVDHWADLVAEGRLEALCHSLAADHYDPAYRKSMSALTPRVRDVFHADALNDAAQDDLADRIAARLQTIEI
ncbi:tRNA 2-selenouridine(34) synthase MnmH [Sagittula stellata]|uniref:tRNA 2-selenouridine synthase, selenophosphate-dependent n=1 Tax=Sagittula stellata (strain ATCC 700073 / DSM 11524 / E-37) TaxID=388399 RepID=A3K8E3_SAGS3|nr:tRNA 2-selenouridine(34) synthase MnmH [Sagittula stellata]EBA06622.1 tRNA 2-selenouridine synthase, selenophosphate-dependent [Sagittula stellata E-37]